MKYSLISTFDGSIHYTLDGETLSANFDRQYGKQINEWSDNELITECVKKFEFLLELVRDYGVESFDTYGVYTCALCQRYYDGGCYECPIAKFSGSTQCDDTPYRNYAENHNYSEFDVERFLVNEIAFLKSLPEYKENKFLYDPNDYYISEG